MGRGSNLSVIGLYNYNNALFEGLSLPSDMTADDKTILIDNILMECADLEVIYPSWPFMHRAISSWSAKQLPTWNRIYKLSRMEYDPLENYNRTETVTETREGNQAHSGNDVVAMSGADTDSSTVSETLDETGTNTHTTTGTDTIAHTGTDTHKTTGTDTIDHTGTDTHKTTGTDTVEHSGTDTNKHTGTDTTATTGTDMDDTTRTNVETSSGNNSTAVTAGNGVTHSGSDITTEQKTAFDSASFADTRKTTLAHGEVINTTENSTTTGTASATINHDDDESVTHTHNTTVTVTKDLTDLETLATQDETTYNKTDTETLATQDQTTYNKTDTETLATQDQTTYNKTETDTIDQDTARDITTSETHQKGTSETTTHGLTIAQDETVTRNVHMYGNIGVTTSQQMATQEIELAPKLNLFNIIVDEFRERFCLQVY